MEAETECPAGPEDAEGPFLRLIEKDIEDNPGSLVPLTEACMARARELTAGVIVDIDEVIGEDITL